MNYNNVEEELVEAVEQRPKANVKEFMTTNTNLSVEILNKVEMLIGYLCGDRPEMEKSRSPKCLLKELEATTDFLSETNRDVEVIMKMLGV